MDSTHEALRGPKLSRTKLWGFFFTFFFFALKKNIRFCLNVKNDLEPQLLYGLNKLT